MNSFKKYTAILLVFLLAVCAVSCVDNGDGDGTTVSSTESGSTIFTGSEADTSDSAGVESTEKETDDPSDPGMEDIFDDLKGDGSDKILL